MTQKLKITVNKIINFLKKKPVLSGLSSVVVLSVVVFILNADNQSQKTLTLLPGDFVQQVSVSGKVVATENTDLSFEQGGKITSLPVKIGDKVFFGRLLASQDISELNAEYLEMQAGIDVEKAKLNQLLSGSSLEDIQIAETTVSNAKVAVLDAEENLKDKIKDSYTKTDDAVRGKADQLFSSSGSANPQLSLNASIDSALEAEAEQKRVLISSILSSWSLEISNLLSSSLSLTSLTNISKNNLEEIKFFLDKISLILSTLSTNSNLTQATIDKWKTDISTARTNVNTAITNLISADAGLKTALGDLKTAENELTLEKAPARSTDVALYEAQIRQAEASTKGVLAKISKRQIFAPFNGVITRINGKLGSVIGGNETTLSIISNEALQIESYVPEIKIPLIEIGDEAVIILDAYGESVPFLAKVISIDPAETLRDGISTYRIKLQLIEQGGVIRSGMTANVLITTEKKSGVLTVPQGVVTTENGKKFVKVLIGKEIVEKAVVTGSVSSLGHIEIVSGLKEGDVVILQ